MSAQTNFAPRGMSMHAVAPKKNPKVPPLEKIYNSKTGQQVVLNSYDQNIANINQKMMNSLGFEVNITTLTTLIAQVSEQKFFTVRPSDFMPVVVGNGGWSTHLTTFRSFSMSGDFEEGIINTAAHNSRLATADAGIDSVTVDVFTWAKESNWTVPQIAYAAKFGNWDLITNLMESRKKNYDLGIQKIAFLGSATNTRCRGLLNQSGVNTNSTIITKPISSMDPTEFSAFVETVVEAYRDNCNRTNWADRFAIPESDWNGLTSPVSPTFPFNSKLEYLEKSFKTAFMNQDFKILPLAYGDKKYSGFSKQIYALYNGSDPKSLRIDNPVPYTATAANSLNTFQFQNVAYAQFTGAQAYRPLEILYFSY